MEKTLSLNNKKANGGENNYSNTKIIKDPLDYSKSYYGKDFSRFSWPPRPYTCSFCKREFRSAQALGGHMNVHRRDRARLRQSPPWDIDHHQANVPNLNQNPNPNFNSSSTTTSSTKQLPPFTSTFPTQSVTCLASSPSYVEKISPQDHLFGPSSSNGRVEKYFKKANVMKTLFEFGELKGFEKGEDDDQFKNLNKSSHDHIVRLDLEIGLCSEDDLDLELRLGYS